MQNGYLLLTGEESRVTLSRRSTDIAITQKYPHISSFHSLIKSRGGTFLRHPVSLEYLLISSFHNLSYLYVRFRVVVHTYVNMNHSNTPFTLAS